MAHTITLHIDGDAISAEVFRQKVGYFLDMLHKVDRSVTEDADTPPDADTSIKWVVQSIHSGSPVDLTLRGEPVADEVPAHVAERVITFVTAGLEKIASHPTLDEPPSYFTLPALEDVRNLVRPVLDDVTGIKVMTPERTILLADHTRENLDRFLRPAFEHDGSVEGILQTVSVAGGQPRFTLFDRLSKRAIRCAVAREQIPDALQAFDRRVAVYGRVRTNQLGDVLSVRTERIRVFPRDDELPSVEQVAGAFDLARGKTISEHLDHLRDAS